METLTKILVYGPVIIHEGRLLVTKDGKDPFYKIPGGKLEPTDKTPQDCCIRELREETGHECIVLEELPTMTIEKTKDGKPVVIELHHYRAQITSKNIPSTTYFYTDPKTGERHEVTWIAIKGIARRKEELAPNIWFLYEQGALNP